MTEPQGTRFGERDETHGYLETGDTLEAVKRLKFGALLLLEAPIEKEAATFISSIITSLIPQMPTEYGLRGQENCPLTVPAP